jgi:hypothetical protein
MAVGASGGTHPGLRELASGVDALYLSASPAVSMVLFEDLAGLRQGAQEAGSEVSMWVGGEEFGVSGGGFNRYRYCLKHENAWIGFTPSEHLPSVYVQLRAPFLHAVGVPAAVEWVTSVVEALTSARVDWTVSRVDLFADVQGWVPDADDRHRMVCRAKAVATYEDNGALTGFLFGKRRSGTILARIYDKTRKIGEDGDMWWFDKWGPDCNSGQAVWRVEFELHRAVLSQCELETVADTLASLDRLWAYAADRWLTLRDDPGTDETRSRWPVCEVWRKVQSVSLRGESIGLERVYRGQREGSLVRLLPFLRGYLTSAGAVLDRSSLDALLPKIRAILLADEERTGVAFETLVSMKQKQLRYA